MSEIVCLIVFSPDPITAISQHYDMLLQQGRLQELDQLTQDLLRRRGQVQQSAQNPFGPGNTK